jgi:hypothetical protein
MKVKKSVKILFPALILTVSVSAFAAPASTWLVILNQSPLAMNVQAPIKGMSVQIVVPRLSQAKYGPYKLEVYKPFNIFDNRADTAGFGRCITNIPKNTQLVELRITGEKMLPNGKRWVECSVRVIK